MKNLNIVTKLLSLGMCLFLGTSMMAQGQIAGTVTDESGEALIGANVLVQGTTEGTTSDLDGTFSFNTTKAFPLTIVVSYTGFNSQDIELSGPASDLRIVLSEGILLGDDVVISASRRREKVQEAPASVSVLSARKLEGTAQATDPTRNLINVPGVQITQQSAARINIELRGGVSLFGTGAFPIRDYRSLVGPGIGTFDSNGAGINNIDLARIEVVRGAGSALYGPGVTAGVVHFITKNPIDYPGTTVEVIGGELSTFGGTIRHAGVNENKTFGYKINASYKRGDEFTLDGSEGTTDAAGVFTRQLDKFQTVIGQPGLTNGRVNSGLPSETLLTLTPRADGNVMQDFWKSFSTDVTLEFRPKDNTSYTFSGGYNNASSVFYNDLGEGLSQFSEYWAQARMQSGGLFAQFFYVTNDGGGKDETPTFLYQTGNRSPVGRDQIEAQLQYNFDVPSLLDGNITVGMDYRQAISDTEGLVYGENEDDDGFTVVGGYVQGKFALGPKFDFIAAGRYDRFDYLGKGAFSPRAALVFKADPKHTFRASYNHATFAPSALEWNIDFPVSVLVPGVFDFWLAGQRDVQSFGSNPMIEFLNQNVVAAGVAAATGLPLDLLLTLAANLPDELPATNIGTQGLSNEFIHTVASGSLLAQMQANPALAPLIPAVQGILANGPTGNNGVFFGVNAFDGTPLSGLDNTIIGQIGSTKTYELGYKGLFGDKLGASLDVYRITINGSTDFTQIAPLISLVGTDLSAFDAITGQLVGLFVGAGLPQESAIALATAYGGTAQLVPAFYGTGAVETDGVPQDDGILHVPAGYRIFDSEYSRWGADLGLEYYVSDPLSIFFNYSWLNDTEFDVDQNDGSGATFQTFLNTPQNKYRLGFNYTGEKGWRGNMTFIHEDEFNSNNGQYSGIGESKNLVDAGIGYKLDNGVSIDLTAQNLFDSEYRAFPNMPLIGRRLLAKLTYTFGDDQ